MSKKPEIIKQGQIKPFMKKYEHKTFLDNRGSFTSLSTKELDMEWNQCNISVNDKKYTFRGMHYQTNPPQKKYIKVLKGKIVDFAYNLETKDFSYVYLNEQDAILIDDNCAHGFLTICPNTIVAYLVKGEYNPDSEHSIAWRDIPELKEFMQENVGMNVLIISLKDALGK